MDLFEDFLEKLADLWSIIYQSLDTPSFLMEPVPDAVIHDILVVGITLSTIAAINLVYLLVGRPKRRRAKMTKEERRLYERRIISDAITDAIEEKVHREEISRNTASHWYFLIGHRCGLTDLFPKPPAKPPPPNPTDVKLAIRERLVDLWKTKKPLPVPVKKPAMEKVLKFEKRPLKSA